MRETLSPWPFVLAAYAIGIGATIILAGWAWLSMKRAEARRDRIRDESRSGSQG